MSTDGLLTGIDLALDPNLLPVQAGAGAGARASAAGKDPAADREGSTDVKMEGDDDNEGSGSSKDASPAAGNVKFESLVNNPFETYGKMPVPQLVSLILQQRQVPFAQLLESHVEEEMGENVGETHGGAEQEERPVSPQLEDSASAGKSPADADAPAASREATQLSETSANLAADQESVESIRTQMVEQINIAMNESSLALETVSLLLSAVRENNAKSSLSPYLKRTIPLGSLNSDRVGAAPDVAKQTSTVQFGLGWKLKSLEESRTLLRETADSLWSIIANEHSYWKMISEVITNSDVVFKIRERGGSTNGNGNGNGGNRVLAIKYGYEDSGSTYALDRGVALLKNNPDLKKLELIPFSGGSDGATNSNIGPASLKRQGSSSWKSPMNRSSSTLSVGTVDASDISGVPLNHVSSGTNGAGHGGGPLTKHFLRVRVFTKIQSEDDYILSGESAVDPQFFATGQIREQIGKFKNIVFEKELMYQLKKECTALISYGVKIENENKIAIELPTEKFEIELVAVVDDVYDEWIMSHGGDADGRGAGSRGTGEEGGEPNPRLNDKRANLVLITLRMLLVVMYKKNLKRRLTNVTAPSDRDNILLIRPILGRLRHQNYKLLLSRIIQDSVLDAVDGSTMTTKSVVTATETATSANPATTDAHIQKLDKDIQTFSRVLQMPVTQFCVTLSAQATLTITLKTSNYCNALTNVRYNGAPGAAPLFDTDFAEFKEMEEFLHFVISEYVVKTEPST